MIKILLCAATFSLTTVISVSVVYGNPVTDAGKVPHIVSSVQFPQSNADLCGKLDRAPR